MLPPFVTVGNAYWQQQFFGTKADRRLNLKQPGFATWVGRSFTRVGYSAACGMRLALAAMRKAADGSATHAAKIADRVEGRAPRHLIPGANINWVDGLDRRTTSHQNATQAQPLASGISGELP